ncbi:LacI family DNA-binding transcriptional regulator [Alkaliphilus serpentinus]|uniref:LacI family transcriptional regulator n=1 Tax=Alkaliphilus serpentinus TaxID=1482731 RepID=A0A833HMV2_9FIRM|nr:LacI family DNA-binding transcriptional regulator [Alkaliphilus serpentinus]KAB3528808.1 LacI family transcriptional regulator [Alkaliphilus serpentinus]
MKVTIKEVAKKAQVSTSTVSRALKNSPLISQVTKDKIKEIVQELGYHPNEIARSLANKSSQTLGMILPASAEDSFVNPFFTQFILGVTRYLESQNYSLLLSSARNEEDELEQIIRIVNSKRVDGIILMTVREEDKNIEFLMENNFPFVVVGTPIKKDEILWIDNNNEVAMFEVTESLIKSGHKRIAFLGGDQKLKVTQNRFLGYKRALNKHGIDYDSNLVVEVDFTEDEGYRSTLRLLRKVHDIDAIVTTDDLIAYGSMRAIKEMGYAIPKGISITGFNNTILAQYLTPSLTSVEINATDLGNHAARLLLDGIDNGKLQHNFYIVDTEFIKRDSSR